jgi:DNA-binding HxlR family transcriptional regulator
LVKSARNLTKVEKEVSGVMNLSGALADRDRWDVADWCPMEHALQLIGTHSAMVLLREAFWGGRRFDDLARRAGVTEQIAAKRLRQLVDAGLLARQPYQEPGQRTRAEYVLTERGRDLFPVLVSLLEFGRLLQGESSAMELVHEGCGAAIVPQVRCTAGHDVSLSEATARITKR